MAFAVAYFSILWFIGFLNRSTLKSFAVYRILLALFTLGISTAEKRYGSIAVKTRWDASFKRFVKKETNFLKAA